MFHSSFFHTSGTLIVFNDIPGLLWGGVKNPWEASQRSQLCLRAGAGGPEQLSLWGSEHARTTPENAEPVQETQAGLGLNAAVPGGLKDAHSPEAHRLCTSTSLPHEPLLPGGHNGPFTLALTFRQVLSCVQACFFTNKMGLVCARPKGFCEEFRRRHIRVQHAAEHLVSARLSVNVVAPVPTLGHITGPGSLLLLQVPTGHKLANPGVYLTHIQSLPIHGASFLTETPATAIRLLCFSQATSLVQKPGHPTPSVLDPHFPPGLSRTSSPAWLPSVEPVEGALELSPSSGAPSTPHAAAPTAYRRQVPSHSPFTMGILQGPSPLSLPTFPQLGLT